MILCKNCIHLRPPLSAGLPLGPFATCAYGMAQHPVTGDKTLPTQNYETCVVLRGSSSPKDCGPDARFFEARELAEVAA